MTGGLSFDKAKLEPIPFPNGKAVIRKVRCKVPAGIGYLTPEKALEIQKHTQLSKHDYKHHIYAQNEQNVYCLYYELEEAGKVHRALRIVGLFQLAKVGLKKECEFYQDKYYNNFETGKGTKKKQLALSYILKVGTKVIFYKEHIDELKELANNELFKRLFRIYKFNEPAPSTVYVYCQNHIEARNNEELGSGDKDLSFDTFQPRVFLKSSKFKAAMEGKHFNVMPDGEIKWIF